MMLVSFYIICTALAVSVRSEENSERAAPASQEENSRYLSRDNPNFLNKLLDPEDMIPDQDTINYILPKLAAKYRSNNYWHSNPNPRFYMFKDVESNEISPGTKLRKIRNKRTEKYVSDLQRLDYKPSLSVQAPLQALRNAYDLNSFRSKMFQNRRLIGDYNTNIKK